MLSERRYTHTDIDGTPMYTTVNRKEFGPVTRANNPEVDKLEDEIGAKIKRLYAMVSPTEDEIQEEFEIVVEDKHTREALYDPEALVGMLNIACGALDQREIAEENGEEDDNG